MQTEIDERKVYFFYVVVGIFVVASFGLIQHLFVYKKFQPLFFVIPALVGAVAGYLLANQKVLKKRIEMQHAQFIAIVEMAEEVSYLQSVTGSYTFMSQSVFELTGYLPSDFYKSSELFTSLVLKEDQQAWSDNYRDVVAGKTVSPIVVRIKHKSGAENWIRYAAIAIYEKDKIVAISATNRNISEQVNRENELESLVLEDALTGLSNRRYLLRELRAMISNKQSFNLILMDLDRFKIVNDSLGHSVGDQLLSEVSHRLKKAMPENGFVTRFGGDEFIFVTDVDCDVEKLVDHLLSVVKEPVELKGYRLQISGSFGWVSAPDDGQDVETLIRFADTAMYHSKKTPNQILTRYAGGASEEHERILKVENGLRQAVEHKLIEPYFQPLIDAKTEELVGVECLARWTDNELGDVSPSEFIPIAESTGLINSLGDLMLVKSIEASIEINRLVGDREIYFAVNVSPIQLGEVGFAQKVLELLRKYNVSPSALVIEVVESLFIGDDLVAVQTLNILRMAGVKVSLDDFGTGYSALAILRDGYIDNLKIDRSFVSEFELKTKDQALVRQIIAMAQEMDLNVIAEGIENERQMALLKQFNCDVLQGYLLGRPMSKEALCKFISNKKSLKIVS